MIIVKLLECTDSSLDGWVSHSTGLAHLIEMRGPESYDSPLAQMIYISFRQVSVGEPWQRSCTCKLIPMQMIQDIQYRRASTFAQTRWQSSPYRNHVKGPDQKLYDIGSELSTIIADADKSKSMSSNEAFTSKRMTLLERCLKLDREMDTWFERLNEEIPPPHYWPEFSNLQNPVDDDQDRKTYPVSFRFPNLFIAKVLLDHWALSIILHSTSLQLYQSLMGGTRPRPDRPEHPADGGRAQATTNIPQNYTVPPPKVAQTPGMIRSLADCIAQSMEYCLSKDMGILGSQWALFSLRAALQTYRYFPDSKELLWLQAVHDRISDEKGVKFSRAIAARSWITRDTSPWRP